LEASTRKVTGLDLVAFFKLALHTTEELPLAELLENVVAVGCRLRAARDHKDQGGTGKAEPGPVDTSPALGARHKTRGSEVTLTAVLDGGAAQHAGLSAGDIIVAVEGVRVPPAGLDEMISRLSMDKSIVMHAFRRDELMQFELRLLPAPPDTCDLWLLEDAAAEQKKERNAWLGVST
jgi:predicted metalloprotease with PDZ domain